MRTSKTLSTALPLCFVLMFFIIPILLLVFTSFWPRAGLWMRPGFTLDAYVRIFSSSARQEAIANTFFLAFLITLINLLLSYPIAYFLAKRIGERKATLVLFLFAAPFMVNPIIRLIALRTLLSQHGLANFFLTSLNLEPLNILYTYPAMVLGYVISFLPFSLFPIWLSITQINNFIIEASEDLGAGTIETFIRVIIPLSSPGIAAACVFTFITSLGYTIIRNFLGPPNLLLINTLVEKSLGIPDPPLSAALATINVLIIAILLGIWLCFFDIRKFLTLGGGASE